MRTQRYIETYTEFSSSALSFFFSLSLVFSKFYVERVVPDSASAWLLDFVYYMWLSIFRATLREMEPVKK